MECKPLAHKHVQCDALYSCEYHALSTFCGSLVDVFVAEIEGLRVKQLEGSILPSMDPDGKELMHTCVWMALVRLLKC